MRYFPVRVSERDKGNTIIRERLGQDPVDMDQARKQIFKDQEFIIECERHSEESRGTRARFSWEIEQKTNELQTIKNLGS